MVGRERKQMYTIQTPIGITPLPVEKRDGRMPRRGFGSLRPAKRWQDALISGNGTIETKTYGHPRKEIVIFGHEDLLEPHLPEGVTYPQTAPRIAGVLDSVRESLLAGEFEQANELAIKAMEESDYTPGIQNNVKRDAFVMEIDTPGSGEIWDYLRSLDFRTGESTVSWTDSYGSWQRQSFVSRSAGVAVQKMCIPEGYDGSITIRACQNRPPDSPGTGERTAPWWWEAQIDLSVEYDEREITIEGVYRKEALPGAGYGCVVRLSTDGQTSAGSDSVEISGAREIEITTAIEWHLSYSGEIIRQLQVRLDETPGYDELATEHGRSHADQFDRVTIDLADDADLLLTSEELLAKEHESEGLCLALVEKIFDMGRYFLLFSHGRTPYVWGHVNINVNLQVASGVQTDLPEMMETYFSWIEGLMDDWRENAKAIFGFGGVLAGAHPDGLGGVLYHTAADYNEPGNSDRPRT
jgi:alpha-L-fucosidase 2